MRVTVMVVVFVSPFSASTCKAKVFLPWARVFGPVPLTEALGLFAAASTVTESILFRTVTM
jgi:hypothetical protein